MIPSFYKSKSGDFTLIEGNCIETLSKFDFHFDMIFADPPYFLSKGFPFCLAQIVILVCEWCCLAQNP